MMKQAKHSEGHSTLGPWLLEDVEFCPSISEAANPSYILARVYSSQEDARLIAAAPDCLKALEAIQDICYGNGTDMLLTSRKQNDIWNYAEQAIAKATS